MIAELMTKLSGASTATKLVGGTALLGVVATVWGRLTMAMNKLKAVFIVGFSLAEHSTDWEQSAVILYLRTHFKVIGARRWSFTAWRCYRKDKNERTTLSPFREFMPRNDFLLFVKKWTFVFMNYDGGGENTSAKMTVWTFRFLMKPEDFFRKAIEEWDELTHRQKTQENPRFQITTRMGNRGLQKQLGTSLDEVEACGESTRDTANLKARFMPLGFDWNDIVLDGVGEKEIYALTDYLKQAYREAEFWVKSKQWYLDRGIPWRRGWLLTGPPGVGKTAFIRWMAKELDLPIIVFDLTTYSNNDFVTAWRRVTDHSPCIALIEDIDAVYDGRKNITDTEMEKGVTFDRFLNCLDGVQRNDGLFVIITSNHPEKLDTAIGIADNGMSSRPGRVDRVIEIKPLDQRQKTQIATSIMLGFEEYIPNIVAEGKKDNGAQFVERCRKLAEKLYWESESPEIAVADIEEVETAYEHGT